MAEAGQIAQPATSTVVSPEVSIERRSPRQEAWRRFKRNDLALVGATVALLLNRSGYFCATSRPV